ncbi:hypothetical protein WN71_031415 [Streptomyces mangrovisoli]|uniref:Uncharacterized protein n=1 Tax=Streptomyces mangrovisoli TaxID=1428628 RepID=A0A1J4NNN2_9ACTN|nr:hypothetical protein WN71_031415 [Streptomyces mangrovisoli]
MRQGEAIRRGKATRQGEAVRRACRVLCSAVFVAFRGEPAGVSGSWGVRQQPGAADRAIGNYMMHSQVSRNLREL